MASYALVFSGQGAQHPGMLSWLQPDATLQAMQAQLGVADWRAGWTGAAGLGNRAAQTLLTGTACAAWAQLQPDLPPPAIVAGYSVGELPAFAAAGVFTHATALRLAAARAAAMDAADAAGGPGQATGLLGVTGAPPDALAALCATLDLEVAIRIDAGSAVLGGPRAPLARAQAQGEALGWHCTPLPVALASHTRWMRPAVAAFGAALDAAALARPRCPLASNACGRIRSAPDARLALATQIAQTVRWDECLALVAEQGVRAVLEIGPGQALARQWNARHAEVPARCADEFRSRDAVVAWVRRHAELD